MNPTACQPGRQARRLSPSPWWRRGGQLVIALFLSACAGGPHGVPMASEAPVLPLLPRAADAPGAAAFVRQTAGLAADERHAAAVTQVLAGNVPAYLRRLVPVTLVSGGARVTLFVTPDYISVGSDDDNLRIPLSLPAAAALCRATGCWLPTVPMVDAIYAQADITLEPRPIPPGPAMVTYAVFVEHQRLVAAQLDAIEGAVARLRAGALVAGHKKDLVLTGRLATAPGKVAIYGWHRAPGEPIQPLTTVHAAGYADYSHGVRLVWGQAWVDGRRRPLAQVLADPELAPALTGEGPIDVAALLPAD